jgi:hypothetical protein
MSDRQRTVIDFRTCPSCAAVIWSAAGRDEARKCVLETRGSMGGRGRRPSPSPGGDGPARAAFAGSPTPASFAARLGRPRMAGYARAYASSRSTCDYVSSVIDFRARAKLTSPEERFALIEDEPNLLLGPGRRKPAGLMPTISRRKMEGGRKYPYPRGEGSVENAAVSSRALPAPTDKDAARLVFLAAARSPTTNRDRVVQPGSVGRDRPIAAVGSPKVPPKPPSAPVPTPSFHAAT